MAAPAALTEKKTAFGVKLEDLKAAVLEAEDIDVVVPRPKPYKNAVKFLESLEEEISEKQRVITEAFNELSAARDEWRTSAEAVTDDAAKAAALIEFQQAQEIFESAKNNANVCLSWLARHLSLAETQEGCFSLTIMSQARGEGPGGKDR